MRTMWRDNMGAASSVAYFMLEAVGIVSTVLSLRSAGIVFGDAEVGHSFCVQLCTFAWFSILAGLTGCVFIFPNGGALISISGCILLLISITVGVRGRGVFLIFAALSAVFLVRNTL